MADTALLQEELTKLGLWNHKDSAGRFRYRYQLTSGEFRLTNPMKDQLVEISTCVAAAQRVSRSIASNLQGRCNHLNRTESAFLQSIKASCGGYDFVTQDVGLSPIVKVDLMWDGNLFQIAEIDTYNPRGMAYALFLRQIHLAAGDSDAGHSAITETIRERLQGRKLVWLCSNVERYYAPVIQICADILNQNDISMRIVSELDVGDVCPDTGAGLVDEDEMLMIVPDRMHKNIEARKAAIAFALSHRDRMFVPYAPYMGSKLFLALLTNGSNNKYITEFLSGLIQPDEQELFSKYIPEACPVAKLFGREDFTAFGARGAYVLKAINDSGTKGVYMPHHPEYNSAVSDAVSRKRISYIAQRLTDQSPLTIGGDDHYVRVTAYVDARSGTFLDAELTGTGDDPLVHGTSTCIQLPAII